MEWIERIIDKASALLASLPYDVTTVGLVGAGLLAFAFVWGRIFARTGHHPMKGILMLVPGVNVFMFLSLAFGRWPIERNLSQLRRTLHDSADALRRAA